ncbi:MAG: hypothetical protein IPL28_25555 [Chloroflexi bacterium]|nr:hypothetical protein [Chloroflexota bacterium]
MQETEVARMNGGLASLYYSLRDYFVDYCSLNPEFAAKNETLLIRVSNNENIHQYSYGVPIDQMIAALNMAAPAGTTFGTFADGRGVGWMSSAK